MDVLLRSASGFPAPLGHQSYRRRCFGTTRSILSLPFTKEKAKYAKELEAAINIVQRACRLCVDVQKSLVSSDGRFLEKNDQTPVTIADFGVQALVSLELGNLFPSIPLVAEEDSTFLRANNLVDAVTDVVSDHATLKDKLAENDVLKAIDRGGKDADVFNHMPATYWVLDPIDGTRGFVKRTKALYVVGLALVVKGEIVLGVMGCPNWQNDNYYVSHSDARECEKTNSGLGGIMISHVGCGTWKKTLEDTEHPPAGSPWIRCFVDGCHIVQKGRFCIPESQTWDKIPLSVLFNATSNSEEIGDDEIVLLHACCGSLCKYMMVASGRASVFIVRTQTQKTIKAWDHAVGVICVHEAGGKVTDWMGSTLDFSSDQDERRVIFPSGGVLVTNNRLHDQILGMISSHNSVV